MMERLADWLWYQHRWAGYLLLPLALLFYCVSQIRRWYIQRQSPQALGVPVIVVGNISVGGTGKTPVIVSVVEFLQQQGFKPAVVSRGYGGKVQSYPYALNANSTAELAGDEPLLIYQRCQCPVVVAPKRLEAARYALAHFDVDVILSDDGLQHYALPRDLEIIVVDGKRGLGNRLCLPAGPLRELAGRLKQANFVLVNGDTNQQFSPQQQMFSVQAQSLQALGQTSGLPKQNHVHAVAGIGNPQRFLNSLASSGFSAEPHFFPDHHAFTLSDVQFTDDLPVIMTEKDAVKCAAFKQLSQHWYLPVNAHLPSQFYQDLLQQLTSLKKV